MAVLVDQRLEVDDGFVSVLNSHITWHSSHPLLAVGAYEHERGGMVSIYFDDGTRVAADIAPKIGVKVTTLTWHPTRKLLCIGWENGDLSLWDETDHSTKEAQTKHKRAISVANWSPTGTQLISADVVGSCVGWRLDTQGTLSVIFQHELSTSVSDVVFRMPYYVSRQNEISRLAKAAIDGDEYALNLFTNISSQSTSTGNKMFPTTRESLSFFVGSLSGMVFFVSDSGNCTDILQMEGAIRCLLHYAAKEILIIVTEMLMLAQYKVADDGSVIEHSKLKLSGQNPDVTVKWAGLETLAVCTGEKVLRLWSIESSQNCVLALEGKRFGTTEVITCIAYESSKSILAAGTSHGHVVTWRFISATDSFGRHSLQEEDWKIQPPVKVQGAVRAVSWGTTKQLLGVATVTDSYILSEQEMCYSFADQVAAVQVSSRQLSIDILNHNLSVELRTDVHIRNVFASSSHVAITNGKRLLFYDIGQTSKAKFLSSFNSESQMVIIFENCVFVMEETKIELKTFQGTPKQTIKFTEDEGHPVFMNLCGTYLTVVTTNNWIKILDVSVREIKPHAGPKSLDMIAKDSSYIASAKCNCNGTKVSILTAKNPDKSSKIMDPYLFFWDLESGSMFCFDIQAGVYDSFHNISMNQTPHKAVLQSESPEVTELVYGRLPLSHYWDPEDARLLVCTLKLASSSFSNELKSFERRGRMKRSSSTQTFRWEQKPLVTVMSMFVTSEESLPIQDVFPLREHQQDLIGLKIPFYYVLHKSASKSDQNDQSKKDDTTTGFVKRVTMRDFVGLEDCDKQTRDAVMDFSYYLTSNNMDEAFRAIKMIRNQSVWENMARMCVKTKRLDVASVCLGKMGNARAAKALRESVKYPELEARVAMLAINLGMIADAERLLRACCRYDLLNKLYQDSGQWNKAIEIAEIHDRIHRRSTYYNYAIHLEAKGDVNAAIPMFEKSETHNFEVPRMLFDEPRVLEAYILKNKSKELLQWWAQYMESIGEMETALQYYEAAQDYLSLVRVYCYCSNLEKAAEIANETGDRAACFHLGRQFENQENIKEAVHFFTRARAFTNAIRICKEHGLDEQLYNLAMMSGPQEMLDVARYYEEHTNNQEKAILLYQKSGCVTKAVELAFKYHQFNALQSVVADLNKDSDPKLLQKCAEFFLENKQYDKAVSLLAAAGEYLRALDICMEHNIQVTEELVEKMTIEKDEGDPKIRSQVLEKVGELCMMQENYHLAAKKFTQSGNKALAMRALLKSGDTEKIIFFAGVSRQHEVYVMAANYLQSLDWRQDPEIMKNIISFYTKGKAMDQLAGFYDACMQVEIDEYQNYEKGLSALNEAYKCLVKAPGNQESKMNKIKTKIELIKRFIQARQMFESNTEEAIEQCRSLLSESEIDSTVRKGDIYGFLVERYSQLENYKAAYNLVQEMQTQLKGVNLTYYIPVDILQKIYKVLNIEPPNRIDSYLKDSAKQEKSEGSDEEVEEEYTQENGF